MSTQPRRAAAELDAATLDAAELDAADPLAHLRERYVGSETSLVYFDGNSLGRPLRVTAERLATFVEAEWGGRLIRGWDESWMELPLVVGDEIAAACLGAAPGQTTVGDSTTVLLYKALRAACALRPGRHELVLCRDDFPTDRYVAASVARELGLSLRWVEVDPAGGVSTEDLAAELSGDTAVVLLSHVAYRSAWLADAEGITRAAHDVGAVVLWDLSHSVGSVPLALDDWGVDLAVGCTYKYLGGGPGSPAFVYAAERHHHVLDQPVTGWMGHADPFAMGPDWTPAPGIRRMISGTPPIVGMLGLRDTVATIAEVGMEAVRAKSVSLTSYAIGLADDLLAPLGAEVASPRDPGLRGGHVTVDHPRMREVVARLWERDVIPDYRDPGGLRIGLAPLSTSFAEVEEGMRAAAEVLASS
ncbi:MAG: kynureninase [Nocardioides sp.]